MLAVHAFADEHRHALQADDLGVMLSNLSDHVRNSGSAMGALIEPGGEIAHLVDDRGRLLGPSQALLAFIRHEVGRGARNVAVPVNCSIHCEEIVRQGDASLEWTPTALTALMSAAQRPGIGFAGNSEGVLIFPDFMPAPDGLMTFCKALEMVAGAGRHLSELVDEIPQIHIERRDVQTPWDTKGAVMRRVSSLDGAGDVVLLDGVKVIGEDGWALVIPLPDEPACRIWAEARSGDAARQLVERYARIVERIVDGDVDESP
jgi:mannose-1-phosphate guanylyltransferase/phosphomannomutase